VRERYNHVLRLLKDYEYDDTVKQVVVDSLSTFRAVASKHIGLPDLPEPK
jgi:hypothetical protein